MKKGESKIQLFSRILIGLLVVFLSLYFVSIISGFSPFYNEAVEKNALVEVHDDGNEMNALIEKHFEELRLVEIDLIDKNSHEAIANVLTSYIGLAVLIESLSLVITVKIFLKSHVWLFIYLS